MGHSTAGASPDDARDAEAAQMPAELMPITIDIDVMLAKRKCPWANLPNASASHPSTWPC